MLKAMVVIYKGNTALFHFLPYIVELFGPALVIIQRPALILPQGG